MSLLLKVVSRIGLASVALFALPIFVHAFITPVPPVLKSPNLELRVNGTVARGTLSVAKGTNIILTWKSLGKGCVNNWDGGVSASDNVGSAGILNASRSFVITCYGIGSAQTAKVQVNVVYPDLSISNLTIDGLDPVTVNGKKKPGSYKANATKAYALHAVIKNTGALNITTPFVVQFEAGRKDASGKISFGSMESKTITSLAKGVGVTIDLPRPAASLPSDVYYFRARVDSTSVIDEGAKEANNISKTLGGFIFQ